MKQSEKRGWTRGEKLLWLAPLLFIVGAGAALWGPQIARRQLGLPVVLNATKGSETTMRYIALSQDGSTLAASNAPSHHPKFDGGQIWMWNAHTLQAIAPWSQNTNPEINRALLPSTDNWAFALSPEAKYLAYARTDWTRGTGLVRHPFTLFDASTGRARWRVPGSFYGSTAHFSPDGQTLGFTRGVKNSYEYLFLRVADGKPISRWMSYNLNEAASFAWTPDGNIVSVGTLHHSQERVDYWKRKYTIETRRLRDGKLLSAWPTRWVLSFDLAKDGRLALVTADVNERANLENKRLAVIDNATGRELWSKEFAELAAKSAKFSPDGKTLAVIVSGLTFQMYLLDSQSGALKQTLKFEGQNTLIHGPNIVWSPDGKRLFSFNRTAVLVWDLD